MATLGTHAARAVSAGPHVAASCAFSSCGGFIQLGSLRQCQRLQLGVRELERYGGTLEAGPRADGISGAVFTVRLPV
jgi:hypothetical protein